jgi:hypothetical protein
METKTTNRSAISNDSFEFNLNIFCTNIPCTYFLINVPLPAPKFLSPSIGTQRESDLLGSRKFMVFEFASFCRFAFGEGADYLRLQAEASENNNMLAVMLCKQSVVNHADLRQVFLTFISFSLQQHNSAALTKPHVS